ncbi:hypothetical protein [Croceicoccus naphthovorans]|uniref:Uncharacterized protein n=1 Tax=Croceicoccus naphthovorans TaxID=1348774 RepID=A0A0G3XHJ7_9SPHN|nr:hypothetical protein [Croceicoccus naphthovorans]AKM09878.1 hypothetical protein AB433_07590 [Croceicoccus naphthovorans]MBB3991337.1 hypothetical protein [Croceicoccus naphthovorans]
MLASVQDRHICEIGGTKYGFRTPTLYDPAKMRRILGRQKVRRPSATEFRVAALAGLGEMAKVAGETEEGERQQAIVERWYELLKPIDEDDIDEPDFEKRAVMKSAQETERLVEMTAMRADVMAIEASLERHWPPYAELVADRDYWDEVSRIEVVRLLLESIHGQSLPHDEDGMLQADIYRSIPPAHRVELATFAFRLMAPEGPQRKN